MQSDGARAGITLDLTAIRARQVEDLVRDHAQAVRRLEETQRALADAERSRQDAERARQDAEASLANLVGRKADVDLKNRVLLNENAVLMKRISELVQQLSQATERDLQLLLSAELAVLHRRLDDRNRALFGRSSERRGNKDSESEDDKKKKRKKKRSGGTRSPQVALPVHIVPHTLPQSEIERGCLKCTGGELREMKGQFDTSEEVNRIRVRYEILEHRCQKYRCAGCGWITQADGPDKLIAGGRYSIDLAVETALDKYGDHIPLHRQVRRMARDGLMVTTQALWDQLLRMYVLLLPTLLALHERILRADLCYADESTWRVMSNQGGSKQWWLWAVSDGEAVYFQIVPSRGGDAARQLLQNFAGILMADDYTVYVALEKCRSLSGGVQQVIDEEGNLVDVPTPDFVLVTCLMHIRRYLLKAEKYHPEASPALDDIAELYQIEDLAKERADERIAAAAQPLDKAEARAVLLEERRLLRDSRSREVVARLDAWRTQTLRLDGSALAEAINHLDRVWPRFVKFLEDPKIPLDNGHAEREMRGPVVSRKNYYGSRSDAGARVAALFFSLIHSARGMGLDVRDYLGAAVLRAVRKPGSVWTPWDQAEALQAQADRAKALQGQTEALLAQADQAEAPQAQATEPKPAPSPPTP